MKFLKQPVKVGTLQNLTMRQKQRIGINQSKHWESGFPKAGCQLISAFDHNAFH